MPADIPVEVDIPPPKQSKDDRGAHILCDSMEDMFNQNYTSKSNTDDMPNPLKRRLRKKKSQGSLVNHLEPCPVETQDIDMSPILEQGTNTCLVEKQGANTHPAAKQKLVVSLPMSITGQLPCPLGKVIHVLHPSQWYDECKITDPRFVEAAAITTNTLVTERTPEQCRVYCHHCCAIKDAQPLLFPMEVDMPDDICYWIGQWLWNPIGMPGVIHEEDQGCLNKDDLDVWLWY